MVNLLGRPASKALVKQYFNITEAQATDAWVTMSSAAPPNEPISEQQLKDKFTQVLPPPPLFSELRLLGHYRLTYVTRES